MLNKLVECLFIHFKSFPGVCSVDALISLIELEKFKQRWSTMPPISTKRRITSHLNPLNIKRPRHMTLEIRVLDWDRHKNVAWSNSLMEPQSHS
jgi:hypothetical protein